MKDRFLSYYKRENDAKPLGQIDLNVQSCHAQPSPLNSCFIYYAPSCTPPPPLPTLVQAIFLLNMADI